MPKEDKAAEVPEDATSEESVVASSEPQAEELAEAATRPPDEVEEPTEPPLEQQLEERTADLQRLQAEYSNYRKRVERDRALARSAGEASVLRSLLTVLDDIGRAEEHGELKGGFKAVADAFRAAVKSHRLEAFGASGEVFDPRLHEALFHAGESADAAVTTVDSVIRVGYRVGDDVLRHAQVGVVDPGQGDADEPAVPRKREVPPADAVNDEPPTGEASE